MRPNIAKNAAPLLTLFRSDGIIWLVYANINKGDLYDMPPRIGIL